MKYCVKCNTHKPLSDFGTNRAKKDGLATYCKPCYLIVSRKYASNNPETVRARVAANRERIKEWFSEYRKDLKCEECGQDHPATLDFHHLNPSEKLASVTLMVRETYSIENIKAEIAKCKVLCSNCHRILHWNERNSNELSSDVPPDELPDYSAQGKRTRPCHDHGRLEP